MKYRLLAILVFLLSLSVFTMSFYYRDMFFFIIGVLLTVIAVLLFVFTYVIELYYKDQEFNIEQLEKQGLRRFECKACNTINVLEDVYCRACGEKLEE